MSSRNRAPAAPNYSGLIKQQQQVSSEALALQQQQFEWAKAQYEKDSQLTGQVATNALKLQDLQMQYMQEDRQRYKDVFQPVEDAMVKELDQFNDPAFKEKEMGRAQADVAMAMDAQRSNATRDLEAFGIDPSATRYAGLNQTARTQTGAAQAAAGEAAAQNVDNTRRALQTNIVNVGKGYPAQYNAAGATALGAGGAAANTTLAQTASGANTMGTAPGYMGIASGAINSAGNLMNQQYQNQMSSYNANQQSSSGIGSILGGLAGMGTSLMTAPAGSFAASTLLPAMMALEDGGTVEEPELPQGAIPMHRGPAMALPAAVPAGASPSGGQATDDVTAKLSAGEFVLPKDVVRWYGEEKLQKMIMKAREDQQGAPAKAKTKAALPTPPTYASPSALPMR